MAKPHCILVTIIYFIVMAHIQQDINGRIAFSTLADALIKHFLKRSAPIRLWCVISEEKNCICYSSHLG